MFKLDLELQKWTEEPCLNQARFNHASQAIGNIPYVYGGEDFCRNHLNTIEYLKEQEKSCWFGFNVTREKVWVIVQLDRLLARSSPLMTSMGTDSILILGGQ